MLPECPPGAGGLPPPQVGDTKQLESSQGVNRYKKVHKYTQTDNAKQKLKNVNELFCLFMYLDENQ